MNRKQFFILAVFSTAWELCVCMHFCFVDHISHIERKLEETLNVCIELTLRSRCSEKELRCRGVVVAWRHTYQQSINTQLETGFSSEYDAVVWKANVKKNI